MRKLFVCCGLLSTLIALAGCPKKKGDAADAAADAADPDATATAPAAPAVDDAASAAAELAEASAPAAAPPTAKNAADIAQFPAQTKIENEAAKTASVAAARQSPRGGGNVAALKVGTDVVKTAEYQECFLVTFADPKDANTSLMGWVGKEAFTATSVKDAGVRDAAPDAAPVKDAGVGPQSCGAGQVAVIMAGGLVCKKKCLRDSDCKGGAGSCAVANAVGRVTRVCAGE